MLLLELVFLAPKEPPLEIEPLPASFYLLLLSTKFSSVLLVLI